MSVCSVVEKSAMMRECVVISVLAFIVVGCGVEGEPAGKGWWDVPDNEKWREGDKYEYHPKMTESYNMSLEGRRMAAAEIERPKLRAYFNSKSAEELIPLLCTKFLSFGVGYHVAHNGNQDIISELRSRGESVRDVLRKHKDDNSWIFTDGEFRDAAPVKIGQMCRNLLKELDSAAAGQ